MARILAVLCSDIHLSHNPPVARSAEPDWYAAMLRPWDQVRALQSEYGNVPIVVAGDVFDTWRSPPQLINWAIRNLPKNLYAIPGQHDLPNHSFDLVHCSAYQTLIEAGAIHSITKLMSPCDDLVLHPFRWGVPLTPCKNKDDDVHLAVVHAYCWKAGFSFPGVGDEGNVAARMDALDGFTSAVFGDNHKGFMFGDRVMNCGTFLRRKIDEMDYRPMVGLLDSSGKIQPHYLDCSEDKFIDDAYKLREVKASSGFAEFVSHLKSTTSESLDFRDAVRRYLRENPVRVGTCKLLLESIGG